MGEDDQDPPMLDEDLPEIEINDDFEDVQVSFQPSKQESPQKPGLV